MWLDPFCRTDENSKTFCGAAPKPYQTLYYLKRFFYLIDVETIIACLVESRATTDRGKEQRMKTLRVAWCLAIWMGAAFVSSAAAEGQAPAEGGTLPAISLPAPKDADHGTYLGVSGKKDFSIADIPAEVVIIEIFNMY
jgi:hypothetical protein